ncbi:MAG: DUF3299 domain-containing protein [Hyphomicrobiaceae bacterium]|nr:DUF3299 domain-containing protein [Hyphomicrobiaceae bacterium]
MFWTAVPTSASPRKLDWTDLQPKLPPLADPLNKLGFNRRTDFETIIYVRNLSARDRKNPDNRQALVDAKRFERQFRKAGLDIDALNRAYVAWTEEIKRRGTIVRSDLDGEIRIAGYLLPLEFSEGGVSDFLLVPYVGACIHVPPPPPNQIIFVRASKKFVVRDIFTGAWVTGKISAKALKRKLMLVDGSADIPIGYTITDAKIREYKPR